MTIQQTIEKAIEGGFNATFGDEMMSKKYGDFSRIFLDHLFWQSLGKAMGWDCVDDDDRGYTWMDGHDDEEIREKWRNEWHRFIDHLAEGKTAESFFETL